MRTCSVCKIEKDFSEFHRKKSGHSYMCKDCRKDYMKKHYKKNKETYILKAKQGHEKAKEWYKEYKNSLKCEKCGENHPGCLDFHHKDPNEKEFTISKVVTKGKKKLLEEISKCIVLCSNCHRKLHYEEKHGAIIQ